MSRQRKLVFRVLAVLFILHFLGTSLAMAEPSDPFTGASQSFDLAPAEPESNNVGDWGVAEQRGAATYTFPIDVPPGRNGLAPSLALRYSSHSPLRGGIAVGWSIDIPSIRRDNSLGTEEEAYYRASLGNASGRLVEVPDESPYPGSAFRIDFDGSFTRFFHSTPEVSEAGPRGWVALTNDGVKHYFEQGFDASDNWSRWYITSEVDPFGNRVDYQWSKVYEPNGSQVIDYSLESIEYTINESAGLDAYAKVEFEYWDDVEGQELEVCSYSNIPIGAAPLPTSPGKVEGARRLTAVKTYVRDEPSGPWRLSKEINLEYELRSSVLHYDVTYPVPSPPDIYCTQSPLRYLTQIGITTYDPEGMSTSLPPFNFEYNNRINTTAPVPPFTLPPLQEQTIDTPGYGHYGTTSGGEGTLLDIDSDGIRDRVSVAEEGGVCTLVWQKGLLGGAFDTQEQESPLPTFLWYYETERENPDDTTPEQLPEERCTINGQITQREKANPKDELHDKPWYSREKTVYGYQFIDYTGDGRLDLIIAPNSDPSLSTLLDDYPTNLPLPVDITTTENDAPYDYTWWLYHNAAERPEYNQLYGDESVFSVQAFTIASPVPLSPPGSEEIEINFQVPIKSLPPSVFDLDGDGFLDAITLGSSGASTQFDCEGIPVEGTEPRWCVYFGKGGQTFARGQVWNVPWSYDVGAWSMTEYEEYTSTYYQDTWTVAGLYDVIGDSLSDFVVVNTESGALQAYANNGSGFSNNPVELFRYTPYVDPFVDKTQTIYQATVNPDLADEGHRGYRRRLADLDSDGRLDMISFFGNEGDITAEQSVVVRFNLGDRFGPQVELPSAWLIAKRLLSASDGNWRLDTDFVDVTGDGLSDLVRWNQDDTLTYISSPGLPEAPDLLHAVENGRGLRVEFSYMPTSDPNTVQWTTNRSGNTYLPSVMWVVNEVSVDGGFGTPEMITRYKYEDPQYVSPIDYTGIPERSHFAGFQGTITTSYNENDAPLRQVRRIYAYNESGTPDGRLVEERVYRADEGTFYLHKYQEITWQREPLFFGEVFFTHRDTTLTRTCEPNMTEIECMTQTKNTHRIQETWEDMAPSKMSCGIYVEPVNHPPELYVQTERLEGSSPIVHEGDRRTSYQYLIRYGQCDFVPDDYRVLVAQSELEEAFVDGDNLFFDGRSKTIIHYDPVNALPVRTDVWQNESVVATTKRTFDSQTGNLLSETKPEQAAPGGTGNSVAFIYDSHQLFVETVINELGHRVITTHDVATGALLERKGPNFVALSSTEIVWDRETWKIDGFGRVLEHAVSLDDEYEKYTLQMVDRFTYLDAAKPNRIIEEHRRDFGGDVWLTTDRTVDGLGRLLSETVHLEGNQDAVTTYDYDAAGNLAAIEVPDPRTDGAQVRYEYHHDGLGRLTEFIRPNANAMNGLAITYSGLEKTVQEITADGSGSTKRQVYDVFGRLVELHEFDSEAVIRYEYDANNNLVKIVDAEGNLTELTHDWVGNCIAVTRGTRTWRYDYDLNGNLVEESTPNGGNPILYTYDDLDRMLTVSYPDPIIEMLPTGPPPPPPKRETFLPLIIRAGGSGAVVNPTPTLLGTVIADGLNDALRQVAEMVVLAGVIGVLGFVLVTVGTWPRRNHGWLGQAVQFVLVLALVMQLPPIYPTPIESASAEVSQAAHEQQPVEMQMVTISYSYDNGPNGIGRLSRVELPFGQVSYTYEARGLPIREQRSFTLTDIANVSATQFVEREYNALGLLTSGRWDDGTQWAISYDERGLVDTVEWYDPGAETWQKVADYERLVAGLPRTRSTSFGQVRQFTYDVLGRPTLDTVMRPGHPEGALIATRAYDYTDSGDLASVSGATEGVAATASYTYDAQHCLRTATGPNGYQGIFTYSPTGNIMTADVNWNGSNETRNVRYEYGNVDPQAVDRLVDIETGETYASFVYDRSGNMVHRRTPEGDMALNWDGLDQLRLAHSTQGAEMYLYDQTGTRMLAINQEGVRFWFGESETHYDLEGIQTRRYLHLSAGGPTLARVEDGTKVELQYADALQNLMFSLDADGDVVASFLYGSFGEVVHAAGKEEHRRLFNGKENDASTGLRYFGYRYYDPLALRWNSADPLFHFVPELGQLEPHRMNLYSFSLNNPMRYFDPDGLAEEEGEPVDTRCWWSSSPGQCELRTAMEDYDARWAAKMEELRQWRLNKAAASTTNTTSIDYLHSVVAGSSSVKESIINIIIPIVPGVGPAKSIIEGSIDIGRGQNTGDTARIAKGVAAVSAGIAEKIALVLKVIGKEAASHTIGIILWPYSTYSTYQDVRNIAEPAANAVVKEVYPRLRWFYIDRMIPKY